MAVNYQSEDVKIPNLKRIEVGVWIKQVAHTHSKKVSEITYIFCSDEKILEINKQYLKHDYYTDVITFDYSEDNEISGDIFISTETVKSNSVKFNTSFNEELLRVMIHGVLHLCGFKDTTPEEEEIMRKKEEEALTLIKITN